MKYHKRNYKSILSNNQILCKKTLSQPHSVSGTEPTDLIDVYLGLGLLVWHRRSTLIHLIWIVSVAKILLFTRCMDYTGCIIQHAYGLVKPTRLRLKKKAMRKWICVCDPNLFPLPRWPRRSFPRFFPHFGDAPDAAYPEKVLLFERQNIVFFSTSFDLEQSQFQASKAYGPRDCNKNGSGIISECLKCIWWCLDWLKLDFHQ